MAVFSCLQALLLYVICLQVIHEGDCLINVYPPVRVVPVTGDPGQPLFLTPLIEAGNITAARQAARVGTLKGAENVESYSGYFTVNKNFNSNLFFWFFPAKALPNAPLLLWLQGGPGASSLYGLFAENGPFYVSKRNILKPRKYSWTSTHSVIYIDNPVGTGFSFTESDDGYARNETAVGNDLYCALQQFFTLFPELQKNDFYITGESYAGKYIPALGYAIHTKNPNVTLKINMQGMAIGNGLSDPQNMLKYGDYLYQLGLIDINAQAAFHKEEALIRQYIQDKQWNEAFKGFDTLLNGDMSQNGTMFMNLTGLKSYYNYVYPDGHRRGGDSDLYVQGAAVRRAIHVGSKPYNDGRAVERHLEEDVMQSVKPWVEELLESHRIVTYNGQLDIIVAYPLTLGYLQALQWSAAAAYKTAPRYKWYVDGKLAGFVKHAGHLTEVLVRDAGHMVPADQPKWALDLITRFTSEKAFV